MSKTTNFVLGGLLGVALGAAAAYLLGPAQGTRYDDSYQSRLDRALEEGRKAEEAHRQALWEEFERAKRSRSGGGLQR